ncbi:MAG TPA: transcription elongation factor GreA [Acidimicrobiia bacterium]|nr:transcription elongation factor GreA [Acidimicrobiia bacterium]
MTDESTWLTPAAHAKLSEELEELKTEGRRQMEIRLAEARSHGDLRENGDYDAAKNDQGLMEARIRQVESILATAEVQEAVDDGTVGIGSVVTVVDDDGDEMEYFVAIPENKVPGYLLASPGSPVGQALIGARQGDTVECDAPAGMYSLTITSVRPFRT